MRASVYPLGQLGGDAISVDCGAEGDYRYSQGSLDVA
jgi:hypothetical protein